jgi:hypothetical protein
MATGFARTTDRRDAAGLWVLEANGEVIDISFTGAPTFRAVQKKLATVAISAAAATLTQGLGTVAASTPATTLNTRPQTTSPSNLARLR